MLGERRIGPYSLMNSPNSISCAEIGYFQGLGSINLSKLHVCLKARCHSCCPGFSCNAGIQGYLERASRTASQSWTFISSAVIRSLEMSHSSSPSPEIQIPPIIASQNTEPASHALRCPQSKLRSRSPIRLKCTSRRDPYRKNVVIVNIRSPRCRTIVVLGQSSAAIDTSSCSKRQQSDVVTSWKA